VVAYILPWPRRGHE